MPSMFQKIATVAIDEMVQSRVTPSKYGYFLSKSDLDKLKQDFLSFIETSRNLRVAGDKILNLDDTKSKGKNPSKERT